MTFQTWQDIFIALIMGIVLLFGSPIMQLVKTGLSKLFKKPIEDKWAIFVCAIVAVALALAEMALNGLLVGIHITAATFPAFATTIFSIATIYYRLFLKK